MRVLLRILAANLGVLLVGAAAPGQCTPRWQGGEPAPGPRVSDTISATAWWDPDGPGPSGTVLVIGGSFSIPSVGATHLATYDPVTGRWGAFPAQPNYFVGSIAALSNGDLAIGGPFTTIGRQQIAHVAIWNGSSWYSPGGGVTGGYHPHVHALQAMANGDLVVGGNFSTAGGVAAPGLARWDGSRWHALGAFGGVVKCLAQRPGGNLVVGGAFAAPGQSPNAHIAEWTGSSWITYGAGIGGSYAWVDAVAVLANGDVVASGFFAFASGVRADGFARWDGSAWSAMGTGLSGAPRTFLPLPNGDLLAATVTSLNQVPLHGVARWDGSQWHAHAPLIGNVASMTFLPNGDLLIAGYPQRRDNPFLRGLARWDGTTWHALASGFDNTIAGLVALPDGDLVAYGGFSVAAGAAVPAIARWDGQTWVPMGAAGSTPHPSGGGTCATVDSSGTLWMAGPPPGGVIPGPGNVAKWTESGWQAVDRGIGGVTSIVVVDGQPIVGCATYPGYGQTVARWNGTQFVGVGAGMDGPVHALLKRSDGTLVAGGEFLNSGSTSVSRIAQWDGIAWRPLGPGVDGPVRVLAELPNGDLVAAGDFITDGTGLRPLNLIARWNGTDWQPLGAGLAGDPGTSVRALLVLPNGDLLAGGDFRYASGTPARGIARWDGTTWQTVDGSVDGSVWALAQLANEVFVGGNFSTAGAQDAAHLARLRTGCPAAAVAYGAGCSGLAGIPHLTHASLPWIGSTYRSTCRGVSATGIGVDLFGLQPTQLPLAVLHPAAGAGCLLLTNPDVVTIRLPSNGAITSALQLPNLPALVGAQLHQQMVVGEVTATLAITNLASSNALALTVGVF